MRYVRFLKTPRVVAEKSTSRNEVCCLVTITSDLGDFFLPYDIELSAELLGCAGPKEYVLVWKTVQWTGGMRSLSIAIPLSKTQQSWAGLRVRVGAGPKRTHDDYASLSEQDARGVVSAWSATFAPNVEAQKLVERRFKPPQGPISGIWEETGESIARHLWDAGIALSCHLVELTNKNTELSKALLPPVVSSPLRVLELGTGCGMVGITLAQTIADARVTLTDLPEAREIVQRNIDTASRAKGASLVFQELDWDTEIPLQLQKSLKHLALVVAADCTYNPDSSPALVNTLSRLAKMSSGVIIAVAMKMRHSSEEIFFDLMAAAGFQETSKIMFPLPGDEEIGEEIVYLHVYKYATCS
ncbi:hypothetical protein BDW02DRAFT_602045 [Decorospora gaudefroyi]|uniref:Uncharacterized protein n=1 Tax=Decorospora gaudefroyi TaxID=184978 RepID=A0A6A5K6B9_9PLEO|nr:hypothetical protein BDW02DRAFT_602045 [Decorospora gaudefroyi]